MGFVDKSKGTKPQFASTGNASSWFDDLPFDYLTLNRFLKDEASFYGNMGTVYSFV